MTGNLKVGDKVLHEHSRGRMAIVTIEQETRTLWVTDDGSKFRKTTLRGISNDVWYQSWIEPLTEESYARYAAWAEDQRRRVIWNNIKRLPLPDMPSKRLKAIFNELKGKEVAK